MIKELTDCLPSLSFHRLFDRKPNIMHNTRKRLCLTGAQFIFPHLGHDKAVTIEESATLNVEFSIRSQCNSSLSLLSTINVERPSKKQQGSENTERVCQFAHVNGSCVGGTSECQCPANSSGLYTLVQTADRSYNGTWTWSSDPPLVQQTDLDVIVRCKYLSFFVAFVCLVLVCFRMCKRLFLFCF